MKLKTKFTFLGLAGLVARDAVLLRAGLPLRDWTVCDGLTERDLDLAVTWLTPVTPALVGFDLNIC
jgi:hypothetical protein